MSKAKKEKKLKCGDVIKVPAGLKKALKIIHEKGEDAIYAAELFMHTHREHKKDFWDEIYKKYPEVRGCSSKCDLKKGEIIITGGKDDTPGLAELLKGKKGWKPTITK